MGSHTSFEIQQPSEDPQDAVDLCIMFAILFKMFTHTGPSLLQTNSITNLQTSERYFIAELKQE